LEGGVELGAGAGCMRLLPVVERELRVAVRRRSTYWTRLAAAGLAILLSSGMLVFWTDFHTGASQGKSLFQSLAVIALAFCLGAGPLFTADLLSQEKREGTLGLLFLTDLRGYDVVLGKLAAAAVPAVFSLAATLPVMALSLLLGGVALVELGRVALLLAVGLGFSLALGLTVSGHSVNARSAFAVTVFSLFLLVGCLPWLQAELGSSRAANSLGRVLAWFNFWQAFEYIWAVQYAAQPGMFHRPLLGVLGLTMGLVGWTSVVLPRWWRAEGGGLDHRGRERWHRLRFGVGRKRGERRRRYLERNPLLWLGARERLKPVLLWAFAGLGSLGWVLWAVLWAGVRGGDWLSWGTTIVIAYFLQTPLKWLLASEATHRWVESRQSGAFELLLTTPLTVSEILRGHGLALRHLFLGPSMAVLGTQGLMLWLGSGRGMQESEAGWFALVNMVVFLWDLHTLGWVGLWLGLVHRQANRAFMAVVFRVLVVPWLLCFTLLFFGGLQFGGSFAAVWLFASGAVNVFNWLSAREHLRGQFRRLAAAVLDGAGD